MFMMILIHYSKMKMIILCFSIQIIVWHVKLFLQFLKNWLFVIILVEICLIYSFIELIILSIHFFKPHQQLFISKIIMIILSFIREEFNWICCRDLLKVLGILKLLVIFNLQKNLLINYML